MATKAEWVTTLMTKHPYGTLKRSVDGVEITLSNAEHDTTIDEWATVNAAGEAYDTVNDGGGSHAQYARLRNDTMCNHNLSKGETCVEVHGYTSIPNQLDQLYHDVDDGKFGADAKTGAWYLAIKAVKDKYTKP